MYDDLRQRIIDWFCGNDEVHDFMANMKKKYNCYEPNNLISDTVNEILADLYENTVEDEEYDLAISFEAFLYNTYYVGETFEEVAKEFFDTSYNKFFDYDEMLELLKEHNFDSIDYHLAK